MIKISPCYKCEERHELCHSKCERYELYQLALKEEKKGRKESAEFDSYLAVATKRRSGK